MNARQSTEFGPLARFVIVARHLGEIVNWVQPSFAARGSFERADTIDAMHWQVKQWKQKGYVVTVERPGPASNRTARHAR